MYLVQLLLPLYDNAQQPLPHTLFEQLFIELTEAFGGVTAYQRAPAEGAWKASTERVSYDDVVYDDVVYDDVVVFEVMVEPLEREWWQAYRRQLEERFRQEKLLIRAIAVEEL
jgi:hypothetical protein